MLMMLIVFVKFHHSWTESWQSPLGDLGLGEHLVLMLICLGSRGHRCGSYIRLQCIKALFMTGDSGTPPRMCLFGGGSAGGGNNPAPSITRNVHTSITTTIKRHNQCNPE